jgi:hypothetical protein
VVARGGFSADEIVGATYGRPSGSLALIACPRPSSGDMGEGLVTAASALRSSLLLFSRPERRSLSLLVQRSAASHLEFVVPQALRCGGCSYPREWNRSSDCVGVSTRGSLDRRVNCRCVSQPRWVGARRDTKGENSKGNPRPSCCPAPRADGCTCSRGLQAFAWEGERARALCVGPFSRAANLLVREPWTFLL